CVGVHPGALPPARDRYGGHCGAPLCGARCHFFKNGQIFLGVSIIIPIFVASITLMPYHYAITATSAATSAAPSPAKYE
ncbi:MAG: hypothetical protein LIP03_02445, partial [Bacteroidales bacterium]|nr:hypothetical protein [Bacteroidales bacterium]